MQFTQVPAHAVSPAQPHRPHTGTHPGLTLVTPLNGCAIHTSSCPRGKSGTASSASYRHAPYSDDVAYVCLVPGAAADALVIIISCITLLVIDFSQVHHTSWSSGAIAKG